MHTFELFCELIPIQGPSLAQLILHVASGLAPTHRPFTMATESSISEDCNVDLPINLDGVEHLTCNICAVRVTDDSPLTSLTLLPKYGKTVPWAKYQVVKDDSQKPICRKPVGNFDAICRNVFFALGKDEEHKGLKKYYIHLCKPDNAQEGRAFVKFRATWVSEHNSGDGSVRLKASVDFKKKFERLISEQMEQHEWEEAGDWEFVPVSKWDPKLDGKLEPEKITTATVFGELLEGCYVMRGRAGVYRFKHKEITGTRRTHVEVDGTEPLAAEKMQNKLAAARDSRKKFEKQRESHSVVQPHSASGIMDELLQMLQKSGGVALGSNAGSSDSASGPAQPQPASGHAKREVVSESDSDDGCASSNGLRGLFSGPIATHSTSKPIAKKTGTAKAAASPATGKGRSNVVMLDSPSPAKTVQSALLLNLENGGGQDDGEVVQMDGRVKRILDSLTKELDTITSKIDNISFSEDLQTQGSKETRKRWLTFIRQRFAR